LVDVDFFQGSLGETEIGDLPDSRRFILAFLCTKKILEVGNRCFAFSSKVFFFLFLMS